MAHSAAKFGNNNLITALNEYNANFIHTILQKESPLHYALLNSQTKTARLMVKLMFERVENKPNEINELQNCVKQTGVFKYCLTKEQMEIFISHGIEPAEQQVIDLLCNLLGSEELPPKNTPVVQYKQLQSALKGKLSVSKKEYIDFLVSKLPKNQDITKLKSGDGETFISAVGKINNPEHLKYCMECLGYEALLRGDTRGSYKASTKYGASDNGYFHGLGSFFSQATTKNNNSSRVTVTNPEDIQEGNKDTTHVNTKLNFSLEKHILSLVCSTACAYLMNKHSNKLPSWTPKVLSNLKITVPTLVIITVLSFIYNNSKDALKTP